MRPNRFESATAQPAVPAILISWLAAFRPCFTAPVWNHILVLVAGAVLAPGKRTVTQVLRVMGLADRPGFGRYHEVLNRARWDPVTWRVDCCFISWRCCCPAARW